MQDARGVWEESMRTQLDTEQERPVLAALGEGPALVASGEGGPYKPMAKAERAGRESEGFIVPMKSRLSRDGGKEPCFGYGRVWR
jgi:hypothetical protein